MNNPPNTRVSNSEQFMMLFDKDRNRLYAYIYAYVTDKAAADDIFQETSITLWSEFSQFELGTNFSKWANGIAFNRVRVYRRINKRFVLGLSEELMESINNNTPTNLSSTELNLHVNAINTNSQIDGCIEYQDESTDNQWSTLQACRALLREVDQQLFDYFYVKNLKAQEIADHTGRSIYAIRKSVQLLRKKLFDCVDQKKQKASS